MKKIASFPLFALALLGVALPATALEYDIGGTTLKIENLFTVGGLLRTQDRNNALIAKSNLNPGLCVARTAPLSSKGNNTFTGDTCTTSQTVRGDTDNSEDFGVGANDMSPNAIYVRAPGSYNINGDNGNLNFDRGDLVHAAAKLTTDFSANVYDFNIFVRTLALFDAQYNSFEETHPDTTVQASSSQFPDAGKDIIGTNLKFLDYFVSRVFTVGDRDVSFKLGNQVLNWGESAFLISNSLNTINPPSQALLRVPGFDIKELFQPVGMLLLGTEVMESVNAEIFYQYEWKNVEVDPVGSFFSTSDLLGPGGQYAMLSFGKAPEDPANLYIALDNANDPLRTVSSDSGRTVYRNKAEEDRREPSGGGQYGASVKIFLEDFNNGTEVGLYFANYHSRLPTAGFIASDAGCIPDPLLGGTPVTNAAALFANCGIVPTVSSQERLLPVDTAQVVIEYPEDIQMYGVSFNTTLGDWAYSGEFAYRPNLPVQIHTVDLLYAAVGPSFPNVDYNLGAAVLPSSRSAAPDFTSVYRGVKHRTGAGANTFGYAPGETILGYERQKVGQFGHTFLKTIGGDNPIEASQITLLFESGFTYVFDMPGLDELQFQGAETNTHISHGGDGTRGISPRDLTGQNLIADDGDGCAGTANPVTSATAVNPRCLRQNPTAQDTSGFGDDFSYGYRAIMLTRYDSALFGANLEGLFGFFHDVGGVTPGIGGNFVEGRKQALLGLRFDYLSKWVGEIRHTWFTGSNIDSSSDRDNLLMFVGYQF